MLTQVMEEDENASNGSYDDKSPSAIDFYDINELCDDNEQNHIDGSDDEDAHITSTDPDDALDRLPIVQKHEEVPGKPLAGTIPAKFRDVDARRVFPDFQDNKVLRFLRLFGPGKQSNLPDIWRSIRKRNCELKEGHQVERTILQSPENYPVCEQESDEEIKLLRYTEPDLPPGSAPKQPIKPLTNHWRFGPAKLWYDMVEVPETAENYDYGFKLQREETSEDFFDSTPDSNFLMVSQMNWEEDVIWDADEVREEVMSSLYKPNKQAGWIPVGADRTMSQFQCRAKVALSRESKCTDVVQKLVKFNKEIVEESTLSYSIFPVENEKLLYDRWEDDVIWDCDAMKRISYPKKLEILDNDIIMEVPEDLSPPIIDEESTEPTKNSAKDKKRPEEKKAPDEDIDINKPDFYNISNDEYYNPKMTQETALKLNYGGSLLQHSIPAVELRAPYFPTYMGPIKLRRFHRPVVRQYSHGVISVEDFHGVRSLTKHIRRKANERLLELEESGGGEMFFMRTPTDLSGKDGDLVLFEMSEEHPTLMQQIGMASKVRNYHRRKPEKEDMIVEYKYGEIAYSHTSPFLGSLQPGESVQAYENHLFRAPIYEHVIPNTDFLIIRTRHKYYIRDLETIYTVGQQLPLIEVPAPKSEKSASFMRDFLMIHIYRLFAKSVEVPKRIKMDTMRKMFPNLKEFSMRKRLNTCAEFQRTGLDSKFWFLKLGFRLPLEEEIRQMVSPEQCCAYYCMLAAEQRLKDAGYGDKFLMADETEGDLLQHRIDDEIKVAPWNTSNAFISAVRGKCLLDLNGVADPTGCGEGFSFIKIANKQWSKEDESLNPAKRTVRGTDADLRRLSLGNAKKILRSYNVPEKEIKSMSRWQIIDVVRTLSTEKAKAGEGESRFARGNFRSQVEHQRRYNEECQRIFDLQNKILSSTEVLSTDEDSSSEEEDSDLEEMGKNLESILSNKKSAAQINLEQEEAQRKDLQNFLSGREQHNEGGQKSKTESGGLDLEGKVLRIYRTYRNSDGSCFERVETVRRPEVIQMYFKIRQSKTEDFIKDYSLDEQTKEEIRREKRRIQDQLRRIKMAEERGVRVPLKKKPKFDPKVRCSVCGAIGHMKSNSKCPMYQGSPALPSIQVAMTEEQEEEEEKSGLIDQNLIKLDETKIIVSKHLIKHADDVRRKSLVLKIPKEAMKAVKKKKNEDPEFEYLSNLPKIANRKRTDPLVSISSIFEKVLNEVKALPETQAFWFPVTLKVAPGYYNVIEHPMDLHTMRSKLRDQKYKNREDFLHDLKLIYDNSSKFNGSHSIFSITAKKMFAHGVSKLIEEDEKLMELEKAINPLLDNDQVAFSFILETIVEEHLKAVPDSWPFHKAVDGKVHRKYYDVIKFPMHLEQLMNNCKYHKYKTVAEFLSDVKLMHTNSLTFNGELNRITQTAKEIVNACNVAIEIYKKQLDHLELSLKQNPIDMSLFEPPPPVEKKKSKRGRKRKYVELVPEFNGDEEEDNFVDVETVDASESSYPASALVHSYVSDNENSRGSDYFQILSPKSYEGSVISDQSEFQGGEQDFQGGRTLSETLGTLSPKSFNESITSDKSEHQASVMDGTSDHFTWSPKSFNESVVSPEPKVPTVSMSDKANAFFSNFDFAESNDSNYEPQSLSFNGYLTMDPTKDLLTAAETYTDASDSLYVVSNNLAESAENLYLPSDDFTNSPEKKEIASSDPVEDSNDFVIDPNSLKVASGSFQSDHMYQKPSCDNICDDLILSDSDSNEGPDDPDELRF